MADELAELNVNVNSSGAFELNKLTKEQYLKFRFLFIEKRAHNSLWIKNSNAKAMELLLSVLVLVLCKKIPTELGLAKVENLHNKIKLLSPAHFAKESS